MNKKEVSKTPRPTAGTYITTGIMTVIALRAITDRQVDATFGQIIYTFLQVICFFIACWRVQWIWGSLLVGLFLIPFFFMLEFLTGLKLSQYVGIWLSAGIILVGTYVIAILGTIQNRISARKK